MIEEAKKKLEKLEYKNRTWHSEWMRQQSIWDEIAMNINEASIDKDDKEAVKFWCLVMDLFKEKYRSNDIE
jgi:hypothetical protein